MTTFTLAAAGDVIGPGDRFWVLRNDGIAAVAELFHAADAGFANHEGSVFDLDTFAGTRAAVNGGGYPLSPAAVATDLHEFGITLMSKANNHATDWGHEGLTESVRNLEAAGIVTAGAGSSRAAAVRARMLPTPAGRVALISCATTFTPPSAAGSPGGEFVARGGIFTVNVTETTLVSADDFAVIERIARSQITDDLDDRSHLQGEVITLGTERFAAAAEPGIRYEVDPRDRAELLKSVRSATQNADVVIVSIHAHQSASGGGSDRHPPQFLIDLLRETIAAGAHAALTTGPHLVRGAELYEHGVIFYGLGSLFLELGSGLGVQPDLLQRLGSEFAELTPAEQMAQLLPLPASWYESIVASIDIDDGVVSAVRVHPITLEHSPTPGIDGWPSPGSKQAAERILATFANCAGQLGQTVTVTDGIGVMSR